MEFLDRTAHVFSLTSYNELPIGYEYNNCDYIFWIDDEYSKKLSTDTYHMKQIRIVIPARYVQIVDEHECKDIAEKDKIHDTPAGKQKVEVLPLKNTVYTTTYTKDVIAPDALHITIDSKYFKLVSSKMFNEKFFENQSLAEYVELSEDDALNALTLDDLDVLYIPSEDPANASMLITFYVIANADMPGTWTSNVLIHLDYDGEEQWCPITVGGQFYSECEELYINGKNMGIDLPKDIIHALYQSSFTDDIANEVLYAEKVKEFLINYNHLKMNVGNYVSAIDSLKWFGYGDKLTLSKLIETDNNFLTQFIHDYFDINNDLLYSYRTFRHSTLLALQMPDNAETGFNDAHKFSEDFWGEGKPIMGDLFDLLVEKRYDESDIIYYRAYYDYLFDELALKLAAVKYYYEKYFLPIHLSVHSASITHRVWANDIKLIQTSSIQSANAPMLTADPDITVKFSGEKYRYIYNQKRYVDENYNEFSDTKALAERTEKLALYINDTCVNVPIRFYSKNPEQYYDCVLLLLKEGRQIYESHFGFFQKKVLDGFADDGTELYHVEPKYKNFIILPKMFNDELDINYWANKDYEIKLLVNGNWYSYKFTMKVPEFQLNFGTLTYRYDMGDTVDKYEIDPSDAEYVDPSSPDYVPGINDRYKLRPFNRFRQINKITNEEVDFNSFMYVPSLVEANDINFTKNIRGLVNYTNEELQKEINEYDASRIQISKILPNLIEGGQYQYGDNIDMTYKMSVKPEDNPPVLFLDVAQQAFLNSHDISGSSIYTNYIRYDFYNNVVITAPMPMPEFAYDDLSIYGGQEPVPVPPEPKPDKDDNWEPLTTDKTRRIKRWRTKKLYDPATMHRYICLFFSETPNDTTDDTKYSIWQNYNREYLDNAERKFVRNAHDGYFYGEFSTDVYYAGEQYFNPENPEQTPEMHANRDWVEVIYDEVEKDTWSVEYSLKNTVIENPVEEVKKGDPYTTSIIYDHKYELIVKVTMGMDDITRDVYADDAITVPEVTGNLIISCYAVNEPSLYIVTPIEELGYPNVAAYLNSSMDDPFHMPEIKLDGDLGMQVVQNGYIGFIAEMSGRLTNGYEFYKWRHTEPAIRTGQTEVKQGDWCPFDCDHCMCDCIHKRPKEDETDPSSETGDAGDKYDIIPIDEDLNERQAYSDILLDNINDLLKRYKESPIIVSNEKYLNRVHIYDLYDSEGNKIPYGSDKYGYMDDYMKLNVKYENTIGDSLELNRDFHFEGIWEQPSWLPNWYREFFTDEGEQMIKYPTKSSFDYDAYLMHDSEYWYIVFISQMTIDHRTFESDINGPAIINYSSKVFDEEGMAKMYKLEGLIGYEEKVDIDFRADLNGIRGYKDFIYEAVGDADRELYIIEYQGKQYAPKIVYRKETWFAIKTGDIFVTDRPTREQAQEVAKNYENAHVEAYVKIATHFELYEYDHATESPTGPLLIDEKGNPIYAEYIEVEKFMTANVKTNDYTLKKYRSGSEFLINRMWFVDAGGVNHFDKDDLIVATIDNVNFPVIMDIGTKWQFTPMSFGMSDTATVESNTNSAIISCGVGNKLHTPGYYNVKVRYSIDAFTQQQYEKQARILVK